MKLQVSQRCCRCCCCCYYYVTRWRLITATLQRRVDAAVKPLYPAAPDFAHWPTWWRRLQPTTTPGILLRSLVYLSWAEYCDERVCRTSPKFFSVLLAALVCSPLAASWYAMYFRSVDDLMFFTTWQVASSSITAKSFADYRPCRVLFVASCRR